MRRANKRKYHYIYKTTCLVTNRYYIGMHSTDNLEDGYIGSGQKLWFSIHKHGRENHKCTILEFLESREALRKREREIVNEEVLKDSRCMNLQLGGGGGWEYATIVLKERMKDPNYRKHRSDISRKGAQTKAINGTQFTSGMLGKTHSSDTKLLMSEKQKGIGNSQFGTCWIFNIDLKKNRKVNKNDLQSWIETGWQVGRKLKWTTDL